MLTWKVIGKKVKRRKSKGGHLRARERFSFCQLRIHLLMRRSGQNKDGGKNTQFSVPFEKYTKPHLHQEKFSEC